MKSVINILIFYISLGVLVGCDATQAADGKVLDNDTKKPIINVAIGKMDGHYMETRSDSNGSFHFMAIGGTNNFDLYFSKKGYSTLKVEYGSGPRPDTIFMMKL